MARQKITVKMENLSGALADILRQASVKNRQYITDELRAVPYAAQGYIARETYAASGLGHKSGDLRNMNYPMPLEVRGDNLQTGIRNPLVYAAIHELGGRTSPHDIRPRIKKALYWPGARHPVKVVHHPGSLIPARPFIQPALSKAFDDFKAKIMSEGGIGL